MRAAANAGASTYAGIVRLVTAAQSAKAPFIRLADWPTPNEVVRLEVWLCHRGGLQMARKRHKPEEIVAKLRQVDVVTSQGMPIADAIRSIGVTEVTYYRWRKEYGGLKSDQVKRLKDLETENSRLRKAISDLTLDKLILQEAARGNY
jgi:putative transposase